MQSDYYRRREEIRRLRKVVNQLQASMEGAQQKERKQWQKEPLYSHVTPNSTFHGVVEKIGLENTKNNFKGKTTNSKL